MKGAHTPYTPGRYGHAAEHGVLCQPVAALGSPSTTDALKLLDQVAVRWQLAHPRRAPSRNEVAAHESGHFIACEVEGIGADEAKIHAVKGPVGWDGWAGSVRGLGRINWLSGFVRFTSSDLRADAVSVLAGPAAEAMFAGGDFLGSFVEIFTVAMMAARLGEMERIDFAAALTTVTGRTARILNFHRGAVIAVADRLSRRKHLTRSEPRIAGLLAAACEWPTDALPPAAEWEKELACRVASAPIDLRALTDEVTRFAREAAP